jgi:predicted CoA-substrate-specific enzyme activase
MDYFMGVDIGSSMSKGVVIDQDCNIVAKHLIKSGFNFTNASNTIKEQLLKDAQINFNRIKYTVSSGYGRKNVNFADANKTEILCHAKGAFYYFGKPAKIVDIGGQDNKVIEVGNSGNVLNFKMNRKCAAGTGAFIEEISSRLDININALEDLARKADKDIKISSFCTVFAQTEIIRLVKEGISLENLAKGIFLSVSQRIMEMDRFTGNIIITGGVIANFPIIRDIITQKTKCNVFIPPFPQYCGAFGAALTAKELFSEG